ncbi:DUF3108 domain-containing protein [Pedobacter caeni]|uniref:Outer membrane lipoprotein-sorting protein n=1 Tax=Pedobacter caeni TaxID=288992 RepID=A0A1M5L2H0_9SPHI|nr:hypothetical protein [Pedobacter caeni]SHG59130.1 hypothetical protein SAMN04488522_106181 [Pedobacter caeni]
MKLSITFLLLFAVSALSAQDKLIPSKKNNTEKWIKNEQFQMKWYALKDTSKFEIGSITNKVSLEKEKVMVITTVEMKQMKGAWADTTVALRKDLKPVYHSSFNPQRDMALSFDQTVTGFYHDKIKKVKTDINEAPVQAYFDGNLYPTLLRWLPLKEGYKQEISIFEYNPSGKKGVITAFVKDSKKGTYQSLKSGLRKVWILSVSDEIGSGMLSTYYIDELDRRLWKQELDAGGRKMLMQRVE